MLRFALFLLLVVCLPFDVEAQQSTQAGGTGCSTPATAARLGVMSPTIGTVCTITDGASATDCTTGGGTDNVTCFYCGAAWQSSSCGGASGGTDVALDLGDTGSNDSAAINEIATSGDTNSIFTEPAADKLLIDVSQNWPVCDAATAADDLSASCNQCVDISANTNLSVGAGLSLVSSNIELLSNASGFLHDGGATSLTCTTGTDGRIQVMDDGSLQYCDGATTSLLQSYDPGTTLTAGTGLTGDFVIDTSSTINCANAAADGSTKGCSTFVAADFDDDGSGLITIQDKFVLTDGDDMSGQLRIGVSGNVPLVATDTDNVASGQPMTLVASGQSTPIAGDGGFISLRTENASNTVADACRIGWEWNDPTGNSEDGELVFSCEQNSGTGELFRAGFNGPTDANFTINPASKDINFIVKDVTASDTLTCDGTTGVCDFANSPTVNGSELARKNVLDIRDYGAVCDGSTDAASNINSAITASEEGDIIFFPGCTNAWRIGSTISLPSTHSITIMGGGSAIDATVGVSDVFAIEDVGQAVNSPQHVIEGLRIYNAGTQGQGNAIRIEDSNSQTLRNLYIQDFDTGINLELDGGFTEANKIEDVRIHDCNTGIYWEKVSGTSSSFASTHLEHVEIVMAAAAAATPIGLDVGAATSIYRSRFDNVIVFPSQTDSIGFYCQGTLRSLTGSLHVESTNGSATGNTGIELAAGCSLMTVDLDVDIRGTIANDFVNGSGSGISGLRVQNIANFPGAEIRDATQKQYFSGSICDDDLSTCRYRKTMSTAGVLRHEFDETLAMEFIDLTTEDIAPVRMKDIGNECNATANDLTPSVADCTQINLVTYSAGSVVTNFDEGISGQTLLVRLQNTDVTVESGNDIRLNHGKDFTCSGAHCVLYLWLDGNSWREISRTDNNSGTYVSKTGDTMSGVLNIDTTVANPLQVYANTGGNANYAQMGCAGTGAGGSLCNMTFTAKNSNGGESIIAMLRHQITDATVGSIDGKMEILLKTNDTIEPIQHWLSDSGGTKTVLVNPGNLDVDFRVYGATNNNMFACDGSTEVCSFLNPPLGLSETTMTKFQTGPVGSAVSDQESNGNVSCVKWFVPGRMAEINIADIVVDTGNGTSTVEFGVFSADGQTQFFECTVAPNTTNGSYECSNTLSAPLIPVRPQDVWICVSTNTATFDAQSTHSTLGGARYCTYSQAATGGAMPTTLTSNPTCTWSAMRPLYVGLSDR